MSACEPDAARDRLLEAIDRDPAALPAYDTYSRISLSYPKPETTERGARVLMRMLVDPRVDNRGPQGSASLTLLWELKLGRDAAERGEARQPAAWFTPLLIALLGQALNCSWKLEPVLTGLRTDLLRRVAGDPTAPVDQHSLDLAEAFARHSFRNEYIWPETEEETALVDKLMACIADALAKGAAAPAAALYMLGAYRELSRVPAIRDWVAAIAAQAPGQLDQSLRLLVLEPLQEATLAPTLPALTEISEGVSESVQAQYEENPYPRWSAISRETPRPYLDSIASAIFPNRPVLKATAEAPRVLIAGCGSGQHPIGSAQRYQDAHVLGVDLSRASLAYAARQALQLGVKNVAFAQADILRLEGIDENFDIIESSGVLHHMADPEAGLRRLVAALKPGGFMNIGLYSRAARSHVSAAREEIAARGYAPDLTGLRAFRRDLMAGQMPAVAPLAISFDFFSASNLRDFAFHVQEHQFDLLEIKTLLETHGLEFLGFSSLPPDVVRKYQHSRPEDPSQTDLASWHAFEMENPQIFSAMYQFWCRKS